MPIVDRNAGAFYDGGANSLYVPALARTTEWLSGFRGDTQELIKALTSVGLVKGQRIVIVHAMFGWVAEEFIAQGYGPIANGTTAGRIVNVDMSTWIHANKAAHATLPILSEDVTTTPGRRNIKSALGSPTQTIDWGIAYEILPDLTDTECATFRTAMRALATKVVHWVTPLAGGPPGQDARLNLKSISAWKTLMTPDYIIGRGSASIV